MRLPFVLLPVLMGLTPVVLFAFFAFAPTTFTVAWQPPNGWSIQFGDTPNFSSGVTSIFAASDGLYSSGYLSYPSVAENATTGGLFVSRYYSDGRQAWIRSFAPYRSSITDARGWIVSGPSPLTAVTLGVGGVIIAGSLGDIGFMRDFDANGTQLWDVQFNGCQYDSDISHVSESPSAVYAVETCRMPGQTIDELQVYNFGGNRISNSTIGLDPQGGRSVNLDSFPDGAIVSSSDDLLGNGFLQRYEANGTLLWTKQLECTSCAITAISINGAAAYVAGNVLSQIGYSNRYQNLFFLDKYDMAGNRLWSHQFSPAVESYNPRMSADSSGIYLSLTEIPDYHFGSISRYDSNGNPVWSLETEVKPCAVSAANGHVYLGGGSKDCLGPQSAGSGQRAFLASFWQTSSLILLGLNPPFSFVLAAAIPVDVAVTVLLLKKHYDAKTLPKKDAQSMEGIPRD